MFLLIYLNNLCCFVQRKRFPWYHTHTLCVIYENFSLRTQQIANFNQFPYFSRIPTLYKRDSLEIHINYFRYFSWRISNEIQSALFMWIEVHERIWFMELHLFSKCGFFGFRAFGSNALNCPQQSNLIHWISYDVLKINRSSNENISRASIGNTCGRQIQDQNTYFFQHKLFGVWFCLIFFALLLVRSLYVYIHQIV